MPIANCLMTESSVFWKTPTGSILSFVGSISGVWNITKGISLLKGNEFKQAGFQLGIGLSRFMLMSFAIHQLSFLVFSKAEKIEPTVSIKKFDDLAKEYADYRYMTLTQCSRIDSKVCNDLVIKAVEGDVNYPTCSFLPWYSYDICKNLSSTSGCQKAVEILCSNSALFLDTCAKAAFSDNLNYSSIQKLHEACHPG